MAADRLILGHVAASLAQEPDRRDINRLTETGAEEALRSGHLGCDRSPMLRAALRCYSGGSRLESAAAVGPGACGSCGGVFHERAESNTETVGRSLSANDRMSKVYREAWATVAGLSLAAGGIELEGSPIERLAEDAATM